MKKLLLTCALGILMAGTVQAAPQQKGECAYSPLQTLVRDARDEQQLAVLAKKGVNLDEVPRCGGTLMQLAIRRGNFNVVKVLLENDLKRANQIVSLDDFPIPGAPKKIPLWLFAAYYAPNEYIISLMRQAMEQASFDIGQTDEYGRNVLWYMELNPVLRKTETFDKLNDALLESLGEVEQGATLNAGFGQNQAGSLTLPETVNSSSKGETQEKNAPSSEKTEKVVEPTK